MALTMFDRARWTGKAREAEVFLHWLHSRLDEAAAALAEYEEGDAADEGPPDDLS
jgi:hypothetical protein